MKELWVSEGSVKEKWMSVKSALCESTQSCSPCDIKEETSKLVPREQLRIEATL